MESNDLVGVHKILDEEFSSNPFNYEINHKKLNSLKFTLEIDSIENSHNEEQTDVLFTYNKDDTCEVKLLQTLEKSFLISAFLKNDCIEIKKGIRIDSQKRSIFKKLEYKYYKS